MLSKPLPVFHSDSFGHKPKANKQPVQKQQAVRIDSVQISQTAKIMNENKKAAQSTIELM